jgi:protein-S-isoprenylcysteine O-methyltransferase Ste14
LITTVIMVVVSAAVPVADWRLLEVHAPWVRLLGPAIVLAATALTLWARLALGAMWTAAPTVKQEHQLRTSGPYAGPGWKLGEWRDGAPCWPLAGCESH